MKSWELAIGRGGVLVVKIYQYIPTFEGLHFTYPGSCTEVPTVFQRVKHKRGTIAHLPLKILRDAGCHRNLNRERTVAEKAGASVLPAASVVRVVLSFKIF